MHDKTARYRENLGHQAPRRLPGTDLRCLAPCEILQKSSKYSKKVCGNSTAVQQRHGQLSHCLCSGSTYATRQLADANSSCILQHKADLAKVCFEGGRGGSGVGNQDKE